MGFLDSLFKKKKPVDNLPRLESSPLDSELPSFEEMAPPGLDEPMPPKPEEFGEHPSLPHDIIPPKGQAHPVAKEEPKPIAKPEMPEFLSTSVGEEDYAEEKEEIMAIKGHVDITKPVFVLVEDYKKILMYMREIKESLGESSEVLLDLNDLKNAEDKLYASWHNNLEDLQRKLIFADKTLFEKSVR